MICPECKKDVAPADGRCPNCEALLTADQEQRADDFAEDQTLIVPGGAAQDSDETLLIGSERGDSGETVWSPVAEDDEGTILAAGSADDLTEVDSSGGSGAAPRSDSGPLELGQEFGKRYHIIKLLGLGGMGAVYQAWDIVLGIVVALKVVRPEIGADPEKAAELDQRFKRELLLAREVTHKNVVRIHDLGEIDGIKYITMSFIDGEDLSSVLKREGKLSVEQALPIIRSVLSGLVAAHDAGVVHRDLKPANIMISSEDGEAHLMDFGVARSTSAESTRPPAIAGLDLAKLDIPDLGATMAGAVVGTLQYMPPEQFRGQIADQRADLYTLGLIFYDMLVGGGRAKSAKSAVSEVLERSEKPPPPIRSVVPEVPEPLEKIISRCLEPNPEDRYQTTRELSEDLGRLDDTGHLQPVKRLLTGKMLVATVGLVMALLAGTWWLATSRAPEQQPDPMSILIADIDNQTGDETFDGAVEQALNIAMEGAGFISSYSRPKAQEVAAQLLPDSALDATMSRLVARREGIDVVLAGSIAAKGSGYRITVKALDAGADSEDGEALATVRESAKSKEDVLPAVGRLASDMRKKLGDTQPESARMAAAETFTAASLEAMNAYAEGQALSVQGQFMEALGSYQRAVEEDPEFGRAYAGMGVVYGNLRQPDEAEESYQKALQYVDRMSERERYRTLGGYYLLVSRNYPEAIASYEKLVELYPADGGGHSNLALSYLYERDFQKAVQEGKVAVDLDPGNMLKRMNYSMYAMYAGDFETSIAESQKVLEQNPSFGYAIFTAARSAAADGRLDEARQMYQDLGSSDALGAALAPIGRADLAVTSGTYRQAAEILEPLAPLSEASAESAPVMVMLAESYLALGRLDEAQELAATASRLNEQESVLYPAARVLIAAGDSEGARTIAGTLENQLQAQTVAYARLIEGEIALLEGRLLEAIEALRDGRERHDTWFAHFLLGRAYFEGEQFAEALGELEICLDRKGEIVDLFLIDSATLRYLPPAYYWLGRVQEELGSTVPARSNYRTYLEIRGNTDAPDPLAADASRRWSALEPSQSATG